MIASSPKWRIWQWLPILSFLLFAKLTCSLSSRFSLPKVNDTMEKMMVIPSFVPRRDGLTPVKNVYGFSNVCDAGECGDFHVVAYYLDQHVCALHVRRLDDANWTFDLSIFIQSLKQRSDDGHRPTFTREIFYIGHSEVHWKTVIVNTTLQLLPDRSMLSRQQIPRTIVQTFATRRAHNLFHWNAYQTFVELNPEYEMRMYTDRECRQFIKRFLPAKVLDAYDILISPTFKADLFRYSYLAIHGGCYFDHKMIARLPLRSVVRANDSLLVCSDANPSTGLPAANLAETERLYNAVICAERGEKRLWRTIDIILKNIQKRHSVGSDLSLTGPLAFYNAIADRLTEHEVRFKHGVRMKSIMHVRRKYEDYYVKEKLSGRIFLTKFYKGFFADPKHRYGTLWRAQTIYYDLLVQHGQWKVLSYPGQSSCIKPEFTAAGSLVLKLLTSNSYYELAPHARHGHMICQSIKVVVLNDYNSEEYRVEIPSIEISSASRYTLQLPLVQPL
eukprot:scaffold1046_cov162-Ochromonas_danica.AAC.47